MVEAEQFELPLRPATPEEVAAQALEDRLARQWAANEAAQAAYWGPDASAIYWWAAGSWDREGWDALPVYERNRWRNEYEAERDRSIATGRAMRPAAFFAGMAEENYRQKREVAEKWAAEIRTAFLQRKPCPIRVEWDWEHVLAWAFDLAAVPPECLAPAPNE